MSAQQFGPYVLSRRLGQGGMAETFVATRQGPGGFAQEVCVKRILPKLERDAEFLSQFEDEARVSSSLRHANVVGVLDFGVAEGLPYLALELVDGMDLYSLLEWHEERRERITSGLVVYIAAEVASALEHAHGKKPRAVVHRDISPSNVLLSRAGEVKLSDFGIAKALREHAKATHTMQLKGKAPYMAPEYASGVFDPRADLFALGVMLYEMLAGRRPYEGRTDLETLLIVQKGEHTALATLCPNVAPRFVAIVEKLIASKADDRFQSAADLLDALVEVAPPPTARKILGELVKRAAPRRSDASMPVPTMSAGTPTPTPSEPTPARAGDATRTKQPGGLITDRTPQLELSALESDPATTRTGLSPELLDALAPTTPATMSSVGMDPSVRAAFEASQRGGAVPITRTQLRSRVPMIAGVSVALIVLVAIAGVIAMVAMR